MGRTAAEATVEQAADEDEAKEEKDGAAEKTKDEDGDVAEDDGDWVDDPVYACFAGGIALGMPQLQSIYSHTQEECTIRLIY